MPDARANANTTAIAVLRITVGVLFLILGEYKVVSTKFVFGGGFQYWINRFLADGAYPFMVPVLRNFVLPHATPIAMMVAFGEVAIGLSLTIGLLSRTASVAGAVYMLSLLFSANYPGPHAPFWQYFGASLEHLVLALCFITFWMGDPEARFSVRRFRRA
jgi:thiosulfate dehydrogenase [quinone] large subunit